MQKLSKNVGVINLPVSRPSKFYVLGVKIRQRIYRNKTSSPYISSDAFQAISDISFPYHEEELTEEFIEKLISAETVFCPSHLASTMLGRFANKMQSKVLIFTNSDFEFHESLVNLPKNLKLVLMENSFVSDSSLFFTVPVGIENLRIGMNGMVSLFKHSRTTRKQEVLFGPFSPTHPMRIEVIRNFLKENGPWRVINRRLNPRRYARISRKYRFVACVRGNSVESHRIWESLYRGCIPIVQKDAWSESLRYLDLPIEYVESWEPHQIHEVVKSSKILNFDPQKQEALWMPYWEDLIKERLKS
jgi:hypothetical protein